MIFNAELDISNFLRKRADLEKRLSDFTEMFEVARIEIRREFENQFEAEGTPRWQSLTLAYAEEKQARWGVKPILEASGKMKKGYTEGGEIEKTELVFVYPTIYARRHQRGYKIPQRALDLEFVESLGLKVMTDYLDSSAEKAGFK